MIGSSNIGLDFDYFETHDFHKLTNKKPSSKAFSLLHTNICSLQANAENLEILISNLGYKFSVIAVSETWSPSRKVNQSVPEIATYQPFYGTKETTTKSGCGFCIKKGLKYKPRKDLDITFCNELNEFQSTWVEIVNDNTQPNIVLGVYYKHPRKGSNELFNNKLENTLQKIQDNNKISITCTEFNCNLLNHNHNNYVRIL